VRQNNSVAAPARPIDVTVSAINTKRVADKWRYLLRITNNDSEPFTGSVTIRLRRADDGTTWCETFESAPQMAAGGITVVYTDAHTGPTAEYREYKITEFDCEAESKDGATSGGSGWISQ
jgi:hypothetical protein